MRVLLVLAMIPLLAACSVSTSSEPVATLGDPPSGTETAAGTTDTAGKWTGMWVGSGLFKSPRQENLTLEMAQRGDAGYGRMVLDGATAAESVPWEVRQQGLGGIRVFATINGSKVRLTHEADDRIFTADLTVMGDQMVGEVKGRKVRLLLARQGSASNAPAREVPPQAARLA